MKYGLGLVVGKFYPPHRGHKLLIDTAIEQSDEVVVIVCVKPSDNIPGDIRSRWLQEIHPEVRVMMIDDRRDENDLRIWAENTIRCLGRAPDAIFTSEAYGDPYADLMGSKHVCVDRARVRVPISGTAVRRDPYANWEYIEPPVRGWFAKRVCVLGAESTGTTTLARRLAERFNTNWVAEYGREYTELKLANNDLVWRSEEFAHIAREQNRRENAAACQSNRVLICDTNSFATILWHRRYMEMPCPEVEAISRETRCDLYLLTGDEIPFVQDGMRDGEHIRHEMHRWFEEALAVQTVPWHLIQGGFQERLDKAVPLIQALFNNDHPGSI